MDDNLLTQPTEAALCGSCYNKVNDNDAFCDNCGYPIKGTEEEQWNFKSNRAVKEIDLADYTKKIKDAGNALFWIAGVCLLSGVIFYFSGDEDLRFGILITYLILSIVFVALGGWSRKKPVAALISGASLYAILQILYLISDPLNILKGIIFKIIIIGAFIKGIKSAIEAEKVKKELNI